jgi:hypothetical protein
MICLPAHKPQADDAQLPTPAIPADGLVNQSTQQSVEKLPDLEQLLNQEISSQSQQSTKCCN